MKLVITMSRRFGTGASIIASELSERLGVPVYDKAYIEEKLNDHEYESEAEAIRKLAEKPCIILGRCASDILKDRMNVLNIFVCADKEDRILRIMQKDHLDHKIIDSFTAKYKNHLSALILVVLCVIYEISESLNKEKRKIDTITY